jgi:uroporphyrinogen decarboxylase
MKYELDLQKFWKENDTGFSPFDTTKSRVPVDLPFDDHYLLEFMAVESSMKYYKDRSYRLDLHKKCNDLMEKEIGIRFFHEKEEMLLSPNRFEVIMGAHWELVEGGTPWLESDVKSIEDVVELIRRAEKLDMRKAAFPEGWSEEKEAFEKTSGRQLKLGGQGHRGPATMATSILGTTNTCMFIMDEPEVMKEFFILLTEKMVEYHKALMEATGNAIGNKYWITDDNCYLFPPKQYLEFCAPFLSRVFAEFAPGPEDERYQHSDSTMEHLMGILNEVGVNSTNFGPTIHPLDIRKEMPRAVIKGQMPPFLLRNGTPEEIIDIARRDIESVGRDGGLVATTAGSIAGGTSLENIRTYMWAIDKYGRYK